jgi:diguanylate cyclase (GGDEF)-like protein
MARVDTPRLNDGRAAAPLASEPPPPAGKAGNQATPGARRGDRSKPGGAAPTGGPADRTDGTAGGAARILIVDDHPDNVTILRGLLEARGYSTLEAHDGEEALAVLGVLDGPRRAGAPLPDLILLDVMLPKLDGFEVARRVKADRSLPFIPIIIQTALDTTEDKVVGLDSGADDYITKPINFAELEARVRSLLRIKSLQEEVERQKEELSAINNQLVRIARTDALTGIDNRRRLEERLVEAFEHSRRLGEPFACVMCDLDLFKSVNDTYGHQAGDAVLRQFAQLLREQAREIDRVGRYGGEEFMLLLPGATPEAAMAFAERVRKVVEGRTFSFAGAVIRRTMSCGVAGWPHPRIPDVGGLVQAADEALYTAKEAGRNRVIRWDAVDGVRRPGQGRNGTSRTQADGSTGQQGDGASDGSADDTFNDPRADDGEQRSSVTTTGRAGRRPAGGGSGGGSRHTPDDDRGAAA